MDKRETTANELRESLASAVETLDGMGRNNLRVGRGLRLGDAGSSAGVLRAFLNVQHGHDGRDATLLFEWPRAAETHKAVASLKRWNEHVSEHLNGDASFEAHCDDVELEDGSDGRRLEVNFSPEDRAAELEKVLALAGRLGLVKKLRDVVARESDASGTDAAAPASAPPRPSNPDQAKIDAIQAHDAFDPALHPSVPLNGEVTNSQGVTFRLVLRRMGATKGPVWIKIPGPGNPTVHVRRHIRRTTDLDD